MRHTCCAAGTSTQSATCAEGLETPRNWCSSGCQSLSTTGAGMQSVQAALECHSCGTLAVRTTAVGRGGGREEGWGVGRRRGGGGSCSCFQAGGRSSSRQRLSFTCNVMLSWTYTHLSLTSHNNNNNTTWGGFVLTGEEPPPHSRELKHALPQAGGLTQSQLSRPMSSGHHTSMEHRPRRKQLNSDTNANNKKYLKEVQEKRK